MKKVRVSTLRDKKQAGEPIVVVTAYDALSAAIAQAAEIDVILVGDSLGNTALGLPDTIQVRLETMLHHGAAVARGAEKPLKIGDMPFMTYKISPEQALENAGRMLQEGGMEAVKVEGGGEMAPTVQRLVGAGIPVMAHIGLLPQSVHAQGGFRVQGREADDAERLIGDAKALEEAGAFCIVLEAMPTALADRITEALRIPTIGIGAGSGCSGQVLVFSDVVGFSEKKVPKFVKKYADLYSGAVGALEEYRREVRERRFPGPDNTYDS